MGSGVCVCRTRLSEPYPAYGRESGRPWTPIGRKAPPHRAFRPPACWAGRIPASLTAPPDRIQMCSAEGRRREQALLVAGPEAPGRVGLSTRGPRRRRANRRGRPVRRVSGLRGPPRSRSGNPDPRRNRSDGRGSDGRLPPRCGPVGRPGPAIGSGPPRVGGHRPHGDVAAGTTWPARRGPERRPPQFLEDQGAADGRLSVGQGAAQAHPARSAIAATTPSGARSVRSVGPGVGGGRPPSGSIGRAVRAGVGPSPTSSRNDAAHSGQGDPEPAGLGVLDRDRPETARRASHGHGAAPETRVGPRPHLQTRPGRWTFQFLRRGGPAKDGGDRLQAGFAASARTIAATRPSQVNAVASAATSQPSRRAASLVTGLRLASRIVRPTRARAVSPSIACNRAAIAELVSVIQSTEAPPRRDGPPSGGNDAASAFRLERRSARRERPAPARLSGSPAPGRRGPGGFVFRTPPGPALGRGFGAEGRGDEVGPEPVARERLGRGRAARGDLDPAEGRGGLGRLRWRRSRKWATPFGRGEDEPVELVEPGDRVGRAATGSSMGRMATVGREQGLGPQVFERCACEASEAPSGRVTTIRRPKRGRSSEPGRARGRREPQPRRRPERRRRARARPSSTSDPESVAESVATTVRCRGKVPRWTIAAGVDRGLAVADQGAGRAAAMQAEVTPM